MITPLNAWWEPPLDARTHEVIVLCLCRDIEHCRMERYISDVRIAVKELDAALARLAACRCGVAG